MGHLGGNRMCTVQGYLMILNIYSQLEYTYEHLKAECLQLEHYCFI